MDSILLMQHIEIYGNIDIIKERFSIFNPSVVNLLNTKIVSVMSEEDKQKIIDMMFKCIIQMKYTEFTSGVMNLIVYDSNFDPQISWKSPTKQIQYSALSQFSIISSRISMEYFMRLLYYLGEKKEFNPKKSAFKDLKKWLFRIDNPFSFFAYQIFKAYKFDRAHRTPEVHATSKLTKEILLLSNQNEKDHNNRSELTNLMLNIWGPLFDILNEKKPHSFSGDPIDKAWFEAHLKDSQEEKAKILEEYKSQME
ncbi:hypothetical protein [Leptospira noguchii]|uniref:hypothetical protein n=1 Tax=Leptospira noguchii TaxID=28182 RepID=UPI001FB80715|nr:hypothetical protein [Leptospira noguchii]UOG50913.1 hypothetical protein MAL00_19320 [Leptospira noguchii]